MDWGDLCLDRFRILIWLCSSKSVALPSYTSSIPLRTCTMVSFIHSIIPSHEKGWTVYLFSSARCLYASFRTINHPWLADNLLSAALVHWLPTITLQQNPLCFRATTPSAVRSKGEAMQCIDLWLQQPLFYLQSLRFVFIVGSSHKSNIKIPGKVRPVSLTLDMTLSSLSYLFT